MKDVRRGPAHERATYVLSGELLGAGIGFVVSGTVAGALSWRWAFAVLTIPASVLAFMIWRRLPEPARGGASRLMPGAREITDVGQSANGRPRRPEEDRDNIARQAIAAEGVSADEDHVLHEDPDRMRLGRAVRYVLSVPTNRWLIAASAIGYFFFAGMRTFALVFVRGHFGLAQSAATAVLFIAGLGAVVGVLVSGRLADRLIGRGKLDARILVGAISYLAAAALLVPSLVLPSLVLAMPALALAAGALSAPNPPLDAARLDVMPARLWGRAEGVRTLLRQSAQTASPLLFGLVADALGGGHAVASQQHVSAATTRGVQYTFLIMLVPLALNGLLLLVARRSYPADVAAATASEGATKRSRRREGARRERAARHRDRPLSRTISSG